MPQSKELSARVERIAFLVPEIMQQLFHGIADSCVELTIPQKKLLHMLWYHGEMKMSDLSKKLSIEQSSATVAVDSLVKRELVLRKGDENDRRVVLVEISNKGKILFKEFLKSFTHNIAQLMEKLPETKQVQVLKTIEGLYEIFKGEVQ